MPHNIYLHSALVLSRKVDRRRPAHVKEANKYFAIDSAIALTVSFVINLAVVSVFAYHFFDHGCATAPGGPLACLSRTEEGVCDCQLIGLAGAHDALAEALGKSAKYIWAVGLLAAGQASTMTGTYAGQYVMEGFLDLQIPLWARVTFTRFVAIGPGLVVAILTENNQNLSDRFQEAINVFNSVLLSFSLLPVLHFTSSSVIMGEHVSSLPLTITIWVLAFGVLAINIYLVVLRIGAGQPWWVYVVTTVVGVIYLAFSYSLVQEDIENGAWAVVEGLPVGWPLKRRLLAWRERRKVRKEGLIGGDGISNVSPKHQRLIESVGDSDGSEPEST
jgi:natural resistance-associated macrophage protein